MDKNTTVSTFMLLQKWPIRFFTQHEAQNYSWDHAEIVASHTLPSKAATNSIVYNTLSTVSAALKVSQTENTSQFEQLVSEPTSF